MGGALAAAGGAAHTNCTNWRNVGVRATRAPPRGGVLVTPSDPHHLSGRSQLGFADYFAAVSFAAECAEAFTGAIRCWYGVPAHMTYGTDVSGSALFGYRS